MRNQATRKLIPYRLKPLLLGLSIFGALSSTSVEADDESKESQRQLYLFFEGREVYQTNCKECHGVTGKGNGSWAIEWTENRPRNFRSGIFKFKTTPTGFLPTENDLKRTIQSGISGTAMPAFKKHLRDEKLEAVIAYIKSFSREWKKEEKHTDPIELPKRPEWMSSLAQSAERAKVGKEVFTTHCVSCHGPTGKGDGPAAAALKDAWEFDIKPADLSGEHYKSGDSPEDAYRTIAVGLDGTPMVGFREVLTETQLWNIVAYLTTLKADSK